jgi:pyruvate/2-oxoacid:ferredoxin oxidoreductase alpha subunit
MLSNEIIQQKVKKFVSVLWQVKGFPMVLILSPNKTDCHDITETLFKVALRIYIPIVLQ